MGLAESREKAKAMIMAGLVQVNDRLVDKAGHLFLNPQPFPLKSPTPRLSAGVA
jgi:predicted rRNA methylase YqxC with S4 and FtsJ domains